MLADAEMYCSNRKAARWINRANRKDSSSSADIKSEIAEGAVVDGYARTFMFADLPLQVGLGQGAGHNSDTAFWFHVKDSPNASARLNSPDELALSSIMYVV